MWSVLALSLLIGAFWWRAEQTRLGAGLSWIVAVAVVCTVTGLLGCLLALGIAHLSVG